MAIDVTMPALSPTMEVGTLAKWHVKLGQTVKSGDIIAEIETDKATMEVEAVDEGTVIELAVPEGLENVPVGTVILRLAGEGRRLRQHRRLRLCPLRWLHRRLLPRLLRRRRLPPQWQRATASSPARSPAASPK